MYAARTMDSLSDTPSQKDSYAAVYHHIVPQKTISDEMFMSYCISKIVYW